MVERGGGTGFALETLQSLAIFGKLLGKELQGDAASEPCVFGLVHHAHAPAPELLDDSIVRDGLADHGGNTMPRSRSCYCGSERRPSSPGSTLSISASL